MIRKVLLSTTLISVILLLVILSCSFAFVLTIKADCETISAYDLHAETSYQQNQKILQMFSNGIQKFSSNGENGTEEYSDIFAGTYLDSEGLLNVCLTTDIPIAMTVEEEQEIIYHIKEYSYTYLYSIYEFLTKNMIELRIQGVGINQKDNVVIIEIRDKSFEMDIINSVQDIGYDKEALRISIINKGNLTNVYNITAGEKIRRGLLGEGGTVGGPARRNSDGLIGIMTNDHVAPSGSTIYIGTKKINKPAINQGWGECDAAFIPFQNSSSWNYHQGTVKDVKTDSNHSLVRYGGNSRIIEGAKTRRFGIKTGMTDGQILATVFSCEASDNDGNFVEYITNCFTYTNAGEGGDSGGPVFICYSGAKSSYYLAGLHFASNRKNPKGFACRTDSIQRDLGITFLTLDNM